MNIRKTIASFAAASLATGILAQVTPFSEDIRQALKGAADKAQASLASAKFAGQSASVFFIEGDSAGYVETLVRDAVVASGNSYVVPNDDESKLLQKIYSEMEFDERKEGMVSPKTVERINGAGLKSTQILIYGNVWTVVDNDRYSLVELSLGAYSIETKEFLWAGSFDCRHYKPGKAPELGFVDIPLEVRETLKNAIAAKIEQSIKAQPKLEAIKTVAILPLVGDESAEYDKDTGSLKAAKDGSYKMDGYVTHIVVDALSRTALVPRNADVQSRAEVRRAMRDKPQVADAILFGAVRGIDIRQTASGNPRTETYEVVADIQLSIESAASQDVLWSDTVLERQTFEETLDVAGIIRENLRYILYAVAALVALLIAWKIIGAMTRAR